VAFGVEGDALRAAQESAWRRYAWRRYAAVFRVPSRVGDDVRTL
jgi:hypothetical protein